MSQCEKYKSACLHLGIVEKEDISETELKSKYRRLALIWHPDKNRSNEAATKFLEIQNSYEFLMKYEGYMEDDGVSECPNEYDENDASYGNQNSNMYSENYQNILFSFLAPVLNSDVFQEIKSRILYVILDRISQKCEEKAIHLLERLDKRMFCKIRELLNSYREILHLSADFLDKVDHSYAAKNQMNECIILSPFLDDLFDDSLYRITENGKTYIIPLWHNELIYDNSGSDLYVRCVPILPDGIEIDEQNNIHVEVKYELNELWRIGEINVNIGKKLFIILCDELKMAKQQTIVLRGQGISRINTASIYDVSERGDICIKIEIFV